MSPDDLKRYIEEEAPGIGVLGNDVSAVVCFRNECTDTVSVDPETLVVEDRDAVDVESEEYDFEKGETTGRVRVEIYCSPACRKEQYSRSVSN